MITKTYYWILYILVTSAAGALIFINRKNAQRNADIVGRRTAKASKVARKRLKAAEKYLRASDADHFYEEMLRAIWGYLSDKLNIPVSQLSRENIASTLEHKGYSTSVIDELVSVLDDCEMARYTPDSSSRMDEVYSRGANAINNLERNSGK